LNRDQELANLLSKFKIKKCFYSPFTQRLILKTNNVKTIQGLNYFTGNHPIIRSHSKSSSRPVDFGHKVWASSLVFIDFLSNNNFNLKDKNILEVGCGWGILGLYLAKKLNCSVLLTDKDKKVLPLVHSHAELNNLEVSTAAASFAKISEDQLKDVNTIVGVEVCYSEEAAKDLSQLFARACKLDVKQIFIVDPGRPDFFGIVCKNTYGFNKKIYDLPGTINGKITQVLHLKKD